MDKPAKPNPKAPGENEEGKYHYNPVGMAGKTEGTEPDAEKPSREDALHRRDEEEKPAS